ncbi:TerB family tellurite resistance protein [Reichenbachiella carrageenanivorans]|uniref:TerB family tellurite resistance protein n=1 Tax=Reichenbachiella carrageenanivorans TaxID=2979869 RepID=A0ABY6D3N2_9BACT|nr:TerB family tellurite resistance protein [Reichenbachiella carrageenanivorans]UXX80774.1 TerB family tellurite resistance protein [Reichenbachiella carrageenanivorans]
MTNNSDFSKLLLKTVFSFMTCDGHISPKEISFIKELAKEKIDLSNIDVDAELKLMVELINLKGLDFFDDYFKKVNNATLTEEQEILLLESAIQTITADDQVKKEEINFLKILRTTLKSPDQKILDKFPKIGKNFIHKDALTEIYIKELYSNYFKENTLPTFDLSQVQDISDSINFGTNE